MFCSEQVAAILLENAARGEAYTIKPVSPSLHLSAIFIVKYFLGLQTDLQVFSERVTN